MSDHKEHIKQYTAADIQRYVQGKLSPREMHAMEKAALDDPFLADAIEGYQQALQEHDDKLVAAQLQQLQQHIQQPEAVKTAAAPVIPFRWWQVAAAAAIIIITGFWMYTLFNRTETASSLQVAKVTTNEKAAQQQVSPAPAPPAAPAEKATVAATDSIAREQTAAKRRSAKSNTHKESSKARVTATNSTWPAPGNNAELKQAADDKAAAASAFVTTQERVAKQENTLAAARQAPPPAVSPAVQEALKRKQEANQAERETELITIAKADTAGRRRSTFGNAFAMGAAKKADTLSGFVKGQVTDQYNNPIAYAYLQLPRNNNNFITDKAGFFKIPVSDSVVDVAVNVSGYNTQNFRLKNSEAMNKLQLQSYNAYFSDARMPAVASAQKVVSVGPGYNNKTTVYDAVPAYGWVAYNQYLEKNKKIPAGANLVSGNVAVSFEVDKKGLLSDFKIEQSLDKLYDAEAIRLIKQGPSWMLLKGHKARVTVVVHF
jgi:hypothetical protein